MRRILTAGRLPVRLAALLLAFASPAFPQEQAGAPMTSILETLELPTDFQQTAALYRLLERSDIEDLKRFIAEAQSLTNPLDKAAGLNIIYGRFADLDPNAAVDYLLGTGRSSSVDMLFTIFSSWAKVDLDAAVAKSRELRVQQHRQVAEQAILMAKVAEGAEVGQLAGRMNGNTSGQFNMLSGVQLLTLAQTDPEAAMQQALQISDWDMQIRFVAKIATMWADQDHKAAMRYSKSLTGERTRDGFQGTLLHHLVKTRTDAAIEYLYDDAFSDDDHARFINRIFESLVEIDSGLAYQHASQLPSQRDREWAMRIVFITLTAHDPERAFELLQQVSEPAMVRKHAPAVLERYAAIDPVGALEWAGDQPANTHEYLTTVISVIARSDPETALTLVTDLPDSQARTASLAAIIRQISATDPALSIQLLDLMGTGRMRHQLEAEIAQSWAARDAGAAINWIMGLPYRQQAMLLVSVADAVAKSDFDLAKALARDIPNTGTRRHWAQVVAGHLGDTNLSEAISWVSSFRDDPIYPELLGDQMRRIAKRDIGQAWALAEEIRDTDRYFSVSHTIVEAWASQDAPAAAAWFRENDQTGDPGAMASSITRNWAEFDIDAAISWAASLEPGSYRDQALGAIVGNPYLGSDQAARLIGAMTNDSSVRLAAHSYLRSIAQYDPAEARQQLARLALMPDIADDMREMLNSLEKACSASDCR